MTARIRFTICLAALVAMAALASGCGTASGGDYGGAHPDYAKALAGSPPPLAALHRQADKLLPGGTAAYEKQIAGLHGYPVVVNVWASWCVPCRQEFPLMQKLAAKYGKKVAFLGVNSEDSNDAAATFLREAPVPYPSFTDPGKDIYDSLNAYGFPNTAYYDRSGKLVYLKPGAYADAGELESDVRRYAVEPG